MKEVGGEIGEDLRMCEDGWPRKRMKISRKTLFIPLFPSHPRLSSQATNSLVWAEEIFSKQRLSRFMSRNRNVCLGLRRFGDG
jgi:hypothetical protein